MSPHLGIVSYGTHVPTYRLDRTAIRAALGSGGGKGERTVACYDEDTTSMAVEAGRRALWDGVAPRAVHFATTAPAYVDKANATAIHAALALEPDIFAADHGGSVRSGMAAFFAAAADGGLAVLSDVRIGRPGSADEAMGGDAAAAFVFGEEAVVAEIVATASLTREFLYRWRAPGEDASQVWEERFGLEEYSPLIANSAAAALAKAGISATDHVIVVSPHLRAAAAGARRLGSDVADDLTATVGFSGAAHAGLVLADVLDRARAGQTILLVSASDGADAVVLRTTEALEERQSDSSVRVQLERGRPVDYPTFLTWRGTLEREPPRRPEPDYPAAPASARGHAWKFAFQASRCTECRHVHLPPQRVCVRCHAVDRMADESLVDKRATVVTYTVDRLAYSLSPPVIEAVLEFEGGGRHGCELTEATPDQVEVGRTVEMTFRRMYTVGGIHNYFWKARPVVDATGERSAEHGE